MRKKQEKKMQFTCLERKKQTSVEKMRANPITMMKQKQKAQKRGRTCVQGQKGFQTPWMTGEGKTKVVDSMPISSEAEKENEAYLTKKLETSQMQKRRQENR